MYLPRQLQALQLLRSIKSSFLRQIEPLLRESGLSLVQTCLLSGVSSGEIENINGVCRSLEMGQGNASTMCKKLEQSGLLRRERCQEDERVVRLSLTEPGQAALCGVFQRIDERWAAAEEDYPQLVQRIIDGLEAAEELLRRTEYPS